MTDGRSRGVSVALLVFFTLLALVTVADYVDHVSRDGSWFQEHPWRWLAFTVGSVTAVVGVILAVRTLLVRAGHTLLDRNSRTLSLAAEALAIGLAVLAHLTVTGPLMDRLFVRGPQALLFDNPLVPAMVAAAVFLALAGATAAVTAIADRMRTRASIGD